MGKALKVGDRGMKIHNIIQQLKSLHENIARSFLYVGQLLKTVRDEKLWNGQWESFDNPEKHNFISEIGYKKSHANALILVYDKFVEQYGIPEETLIRAEWSKLALVAPRVNSREEAEYWANEAANLSSSDLKKTVAEKDTGIASESCSHEDSYTVRYCRTCKTKTVDN